MKSKNIQYQEKIDHLRFFAAFLVLMFHAVVTHFLWKPLGTDQPQASPAYDLLLEGHTAVGLFMTLSGFLFAIICKGKEVNALGFYRNRFLRIYPLFVLFLLLACYLDQTRNSLISLMTSLFFLQNTEGSVYYKWFTEVFWTIAVEFQFYLLFPFILVFFRKYGYKYLLGLIALSNLGLFTVYVTQGSVKTLAYLTIFGRINEFVIGMILGFLFDRLRNKLAHPSYLLLSIATVMLAASHFHGFGGLNRSVNSYVWIYWPTLEALAWGFVIVAYNASNFRLPQPFSRWLALAGTLSFSMYMSHYFFLRTSKWFYLCTITIDQQPLWARPLLEQLKIHPFTASLVFGFCIVFPLTIFASLLTYSLIEKPFLELRSSYTRRAQTAEDELSEAEQIRVPIRV
jgi:peptidoglycan/LPS O-acetylase OafA/YrhL